MKIIATLLALLLFSGMAGAVILDPYKMLQGQQMIPDGAPWVGDGESMYFGTSKDMAVFYNSTSDTLNLTGVTAILDNATISGVTMASGTIADDLVVTGTHTVTTGTGTVTLAGNTAVSGSKTFTTGTGAVVHGGKVYANAALDVVGALRTTGATTVASIVDNGTATFGGKVYANSNLAVVGTAQVSGTTTVNKLNNNGTYSGTAATLSGAMSAAGAVTGASLVDNGTATFGGKVNANSDLAVVGTARTTGIATVAQLNSNGTISGTGASFSGTLSAAGATTLAGTTINSSSTLAVTTADKLTVAGIIVPQAITIPVVLTATSSNGTVFIPISGNYQVIGVSEAHSVAGNYGGTVTAKIVKCTGTDAPASAGVVVMTNTFDLKGTPETIQTGSLAGTNNCKVNTTERLGIRFNNPLTTLAGGCISISLKRIA